MLHVIKSNEIDTIIGKELGKSDWVLVDQDRIDKFADATMDHQFIHVDPEQANPIFGSTIAHGFLSLSLTAVSVIASAQWLVSNISEPRIKQQLRFMFKPYF